jgi:adenylate kinase
MLNIVLFGPPGAGKGTQSQGLIDKYDLVHLSTGDMLRSEIANGTELGMQAKQLMDQGILVPDETVISMIKTRIERFSYANGFIFDGFPRTAAQAEALDRMLGSKGTPITMMLALEVNDDELTRRIMERGKDSGRADDQDESIVRNRISEYNNKTAPLKDYYSAQGKYHAVNGIGNIEEIFGSLCRVIEANYKVKHKAQPAIVVEETHVIVVERSAPAEKARAKKKASAKKKPVSAKATAGKPAAKKKPVKKKPAKKAVKKTPAKKTGKKKSAKKAAPKKKAKRTAKKRPVKKSAKKAAKRKPAKKAAKKKAGKKKSSRNW